MGCACGKLSAAYYDKETPLERLPGKALSDLGTARTVSSRRDENTGVRVPNPMPYYTVGGKVVYFNKTANGSHRSQGVDFERKEEGNHVTMLRHSGVVSRATEAEQVAAGWPRWLAAVASEAIRGWVPRRFDSFDGFEKIGQGTYSNVFLAHDLEQGKIVALKKVRFNHMEPESIRFMAREIHILRRLNHPNILKLEGLVASRKSGSLWLVLEYMEHDLAGLQSHPEIKFTESQVKCYMQQLLRGLDHCHSRGILHRDIKGSNLLLDNHGNLKIADFGLASFYDLHTNLPLTSHVVTLWYRPLELLLGATYYGAAVDLWSAGCILGELYAGKPILPGSNEVEQLHRIFKLCGSPSEEYWRKLMLPQKTICKPQRPYPRVLIETFKRLPTPAIELIDILLSIDPADRGSAASALKSELFRTSPYPCDPLSLPKYPPSKELDAKLRAVEEATRQGGARSKGQKERGSRESRAVPAPEANAELISSMQKRQSDTTKSKSRSEMFSSHLEDVACGFQIDPPKQSQQFMEDSNNNPIHKRASHSGPLVSRASSMKNLKNRDEDTAMSGFVAARRNMLSEERREHSHSQDNIPKLKSRFPGSFKESLDSTLRQQHNNESTNTLQNETNNAVRMVTVSKGNKIHFSGPLSGKVDQMLKDHDRQIQEAARRTRLDNARLRKQLVEGHQL